MDFQSKKSFGKLRLRAFQPYHQILCMLKHVEDVRGKNNLWHQILWIIDQRLKIHTNIHTNLEFDGMVGKP